MPAASIFLKKTKFKKFTTEHSFISIFSAKETSKYKQKTFQYLQQHKFLINCILRSKVNGNMQSFGIRP